MPYIEFTHISPISNTIFSKKCKYYLVSTHIDPTNDNILISKNELIHLQNTNANIYEEEISFPINIKIFIDANTTYTRTNLFIISEDAFKLYSLIFYGVCDFSKYKYNQKSVLKLFSPLIKPPKFKYCDKYNYGKKKDLLAFIDYRFYKSDNFSNERCILFFTKSCHKYNNKQNFMVLNNANKLYIFSRYHDMFFNNNFRSIYIDINRQNMPTNLNPYLNNEFLSPCDSIISKINFGFLCIPLTKYIYIPYHAKLISIKKTKKVNTDSVSYLLESEYYIPKYIEERDLLSSINGSPTQGYNGPGSGTRFYPNTMDPNVSVNLSYEIRIVGPRHNIPVFKITNNKIKSKRIWLESGELLGEIRNNDVKIYIIFNRPIFYYADINNFDKCYIKLNDIVGNLL
jgi:hypothetical protein